MKFYTLTFALCVFIFSGLKAQLPDDFPSITTHKYGETGNGYLFLNVSSQAEGTGYYVFMMDNDGNIIKYVKASDEEYTYDFKMQPNGLLTYAQFIREHSYTGGGDCYHVLLDQDMNQLGTYQMKNGYEAEAHDFQILPNGHILMFGYYMTQMDLSQFIEGAYPDAQVSGGIIQELDAEGNVVFQWRTWDHYNPENYNFTRAKRQTVAAFHLNTINVDTDGNIIFASPSFTKKLNRQTGEIMWNLGGDDNEFTFIGIDSTEGVGQVTGHDFHRRKNGHFLVYDNAGRGGANKNSEAHEYKIDEVNKTAELVWTYAYPVDIKGWHRGNATRMENGNTLIGWGGASGDVIPTCTEVDTDGNIMFEAYFDDPAVESYRAFRIPIGDWKVAEALVTELALGNTYDFIQGDTLDTGVKVEVTSMSGSGYNELTIATYNQAPKFPTFAGKDPSLLAQRVTMKPAYMWLGGKIFFDVDIFNIENPEDITVYFRNSTDEGEFIPLTTTYNFVTGKIVADFDLSEIKTSEFVFGYNDLESIAYTPVPVQPANGDSVNQAETHRLEWYADGLFTYFKLQIATDEDFGNIVVDEDALYDSYYNFETEDNTAYYWRVKTFTEDYDGFKESDWSDTFVFYATEAEITVDKPAAEAKWQYGLDYFIRWKDNFADDVVIELLTDTTATVLDTTGSDGAYKWSIPVDQPIGCRYRIRITDLGDPSVSDISPYYFSITDTAGNDGCSENIAEHLLGSVNVYPVPAHDQLRVDYSLKQNTKLEIRLMNILGQEVKMVFTGTQDQGAHNLVVNTGDLKEGVYILNMRSGKSDFNRKILLSK